MKRNIVVIRLLICSLCLIGVSFNAHAQFGNLGSKLKKAKEAVEKVQDAVDKGQGTVAKGHEPKGFSTILYVTQENGSARGEGTLEKPLKDVQKAIDKATDGTLIRIAQGNYLGTMDCGCLKIKDKYVSLEGGWNDDFTERDVNKYVTKIQPGPDQLGTISMALLQIETAGQRNRSLIIDGITFDMGNALIYAPATDDPRNGWPEGCETGRMMPVGQGNPSVRLLYAKVEGNFIVRNCLFANASCYGMLLSNKGGAWEIYNNVLVSNLYAGVEINGALNQDTHAHESTVDFHHNTILFSWARTKAFEDMGYGYRFRNGVDHSLHHNIFGCSSLGAIDNCWFDNTLPEPKRKICDAEDNLFFMNKGDMILPAAGKWLYVPAKRFDEVETIRKYERNKELPQGSKILELLDQDYLKGFASIKVMEESHYDANSAANQLRSAFGLNQVGTEFVRPSMFGNRYNVEKARTLFGAEADYGAQTFKAD